MSTTLFGARILFSNNEIALMTQKLAESPLQRQLSQCCLEKLFHFCCRNNTEITPKSRKKCWILHSKASYVCYIVTLLWMFFAKLNYDAQINFDIFMFLYQRIIFVLIGSEETGVAYWVQWLGQRLGNLEFVLDFLQRRETFLHSVHIVCFVERASLYNLLHRTNLV